MWKAEKILGSTQLLLPNLQNIPSGLRILSAGAEEKRMSISIKK